MRVGYIRVSSVNQNAVRQLDGIAVERTFTDKASGKDTTRPKLDEMLAFIRDGDTVIVHSMDRLARNLEELRRLVRELTARGVSVRFVKEQLTFTGEDTAMATLLLSVMARYSYSPDMPQGDNETTSLTLGSCVAGSGWSDLVHQWNVSRQDH